MVGDVFAIVPDGIAHCGPRDQEEDEGAEAAVQQTAQKDFLV